MFLINRTRLSSNVSLIQSALDQINLNFNFVILDINENASSKMVSNKDINIYLDPHLHVHFDPHIVL